MKNRPWAAATGSIVDAELGVLVLQAFTVDNNRTLNQIVAEHNAHDALVAALKNAKLAIQAQATLNHGKHAMLPTIDEISAALKLAGAA